MSINYDSKYNENKNNSCEHFDDCNYFKIFKNQFIPTLGIPSIIIPAGGSRNICLDVEVEKFGQVKLTANLNIIVGAISNILIDILRNGKTIINGPQTLFSDQGPISPPRTEDFNFNFTFSTLDTTAAPGKYCYTFILKNIEESFTNIKISNYLISAKTLTRNLKDCESNNCAKNLNLGRFFSVQNYPPLGTSALSIPGFSEQVLTLKTQSLRCSKIKLEANLNIISPNIGSENFFIDLKRNGISLTGGPKKFISFDPPTDFNGGAEINLDLNLVDWCPVTTNQIYTLHLINQPTIPVPLAPLQVDFYSFNAEVTPDQSECKNLSQVQKFPLSGTNALIIQQNSTQSIPIEVFVNEDGKIRLTFCTNISLRTNTGIILYNLRRDCESITNGPQVLLKNLIQGFSSSETQTVNQNIINVDFCAKKGKHIYDFDIINLSLFPIFIDFYSLITEQ